MRRWCHEGYPSDIYANDRDRRTGTLVPLLASLVARGGMGMASSRGPYDFGGSYPLSSLELHGTKSWLNVPMEGQNGTPW
jgi:hypothetical protein